jgi:hypothetical protein
LTQRQPAFLPLPQAFDGLVENSKRALPTCLTNNDRDHPDVPASFANCQISLKTCAERLGIAAEGQILS